MAYSLFPYVVIDQMNIWEAAAEKNSLLIILAGVCVSVPLIVMYTGFVYYIFRGKASNLSYGMDN